MKDLSLLEQIKIYLGVGNISKSKNVAIFAVDSIKEIPVIINHFYKYPLITHKLSDYLIFKQCFEIIKQGEHLTEGGLSEIISLKSTLNLGIPDNLKNAFPNIKAKNRPEYFFKGIPDPFWISGFTSGDGSFHIVHERKNSRTGIEGSATRRIFTRFSIHLHIRELEVLKGIANFFQLYPSIKPLSLCADNKEVVEGNEKKVIISSQSANLQIAKTSDILNKIIPFFNEYPILGMKSLDFEDFKKVSTIIKTKDSLTNVSGATLVNEILKIKSGMNLLRSKRTPK